MSKLLKYKGYAASVEFSVEDKVLHGKIECINDLVTFESANGSDIETAFREAVDDYLETCTALGKSPEKPMTGSFNVRIGSDLHKKALLEAKSMGISLNDYVKKAVKEKLEGKANEKSSSLPADHTESEYIRAI